MRTSIYALFACAFLSVVMKSRGTTNILLFRAPVGQSSFTNLLDCRFYHFEHVVVLGHCRCKYSRVNFLLVNAWRRNSFLEKSQSPKTCAILRGRVSLKFWTSRLIRESLRIYYMTQFKGYHVSSLCGCGQSLLASAPSYFPWVSVKTELDYLQWTRILVRTSINK